MRTSTLGALALGTLLLTACGNPSAGGNSLLQIQHDEELADSLANIIINKEPVADDPTMRSLIEKSIADAKESLAAAQSSQRGASSGVFTDAKEHVDGWVMFRNGNVYTSSDFHSKPGLDLHAYLTTVVDPRDVNFPDVTAIDLGAMPFPYGPMTIPVQLNGVNADTLRTLVLYDAKLKRMHAFSQLSKRQ